MIIWNWHNDEYERLHNLYKAVENIKDTYHEASIKAHELIQRVING